jgi:predicted nucleic acid-binding protein
MSAKRSRKAASQMERDADDNGAMASAATAGAKALENWNADTLALRKVRNAVGQLKRKKSPDAEYLAAFIRKVCEAVER